jgi:hypothetical protein
MNNHHLLIKLLLSGQVELPFFAWCAIGEEQACGFPGLSISLRAWNVLFVEKENNSVW